MLSSHRCCSKQLMWQAGGRFEEDVAVVVCLCSPADQERSFWHYRTVVKVIRYELIDARECSYTLRLPRVPTMEFSDVNFESTGPACWPDTHPRHRQGWKWVAGHLLVLPGWCTAVHYQGRLT